MVEMPFAVGLSHFMPFMRECTLSNLALSGEPQFAAGLSLTNKMCCKKQLIIIKIN